jgi:very-short-patch-repair endonuclease
MGHKSSTVEQVLARIAGPSHGVVTRDEMLRAGVSPKEIYGRAGKGLLIREFPGVYRVGHKAPSREARYLAAVRACGEGAVLSGRAAAHLWGLLPTSAVPEPEVTARTKRRHKGIRTRRARLDRSETTIWLGIPTTTVARTLVDLAASLPAPDLARACHEADVRYGTTPQQVEAVMPPGTKGAGKLRSVLTGDTKVTLSKLERGFLALLKANGLPLPVTNRPAGTKRVDCRWPDRHLTVELDGYTYHHTRHAWEQDRRREREAHARGDDLRRYTYGDVYDEPAPMLRELSALLTAPPGVPARRA